MNNLEALLVDHNSVLYNALDCDCCAYYHDGEPCIYEFRMCEQGYREWLLAEHVDDESCRQDAERANLVREIGTLRAERDRYRDLCGKLLDAADDMRRVRDAFDQFAEVD